MHKENNYEFCKRLLEVHKKDRRDFSLLPKENEFAFQNNVKIYIPENAGEVLLTAAKDFEDYLFTSMKLSASIDYDDGEKKENSVYLYVNSDIGKASERRGHRVSVTKDFVDMCTKMLESQNHDALFQAEWACYKQSKVWIEKVLAIGQ